MAHRPPCRFSRSASASGLLVWLFRQVDAARLWAAVGAGVGSWAWLGEVAARLSRAAVCSSAAGAAEHPSLRARGIVVRLRALLSSSFLVASLLQQLPAQQHRRRRGPRPRHRRRPEVAATLAATVVLVDRGLGLLALVLVAALAAPPPAEPGLRGGGPPVSRGCCVGRPGLRRRRSRSTGAAGAAARHAPGDAAAAWLHADWVDARLARLTSTWPRQRARALASSAAGAVVVQALLVAFYAAVARPPHPGVAVAPGGDGPGVVHRPDDRFPSTASASGEATFVVQLRSPTCRPSGDNLWFAGTR